MLQTFFALLGIKFKTGKMKSHNYGFYGCHKTPWPKTSWGEKGILGLQLVEIAVDCLKSVVSLIFYFVLYYPTLKIITIIPSGNSNVSYYYLFFIYDKY